MTTIQMPQLGETIIEGTILSWLKKEGDTVERDEPLFEISTDKVDTEVPSPVTGVVSKILVAEGETVPVGTSLAEVDDGLGSTAGEPPEDADRSATSQESMKEPEPERAPEAKDELPDRGPRSQVLSPLVRRLAVDHGVDLATVQGTGTGGRITKNDVLSAASSAPVAARPTSRSPTRAAPAPAATEEGEEVVPLSHIRKAIGAHMVGSLQTSAAAWTMVEVNVDRLVKLRDRVKDEFLARHGVKLTYLPMVTRAVTEALHEYPMVNAELRGDDLILRRHVNVGIAVSYDDGLIVPVIKHADSMTVSGLAEAIADLAARARAHRLQPDDVSGATFTITNPGPYGSLLSVPIINQPNTGILALDTIQQRPVVIDDAIAIRSMVYLSMSWDHRVIDGEIATRFLARIKESLETWDFAEDLGL